MKIVLNGKRARSHIWKVVIPGFCIACLVAAAVVTVQATEPPAQKPMIMAEIVVAAKPEEWRAIDPENTLYLELAGGGWSRGWNCCPRCPAAVARWGIDVCPALFFSDPRDCAHANRRPYDILGPVL